MKHTIHLPSRMIQPPMRKHFKLSVPPWEPKPPPLPTPSSKKKETKQHHENKNR